MTTLLFSSKKYRRAPCHQPDPVRLLLRAPGSATLTPTAHAYFQVHTLVEHISPRSTTCLHQTELGRERTRSNLQSSSFFERKNERERESERERERERETERERERERESFTDGGEQSRTLRLATLHRGVQPGFTIFYRAGAKKLENAIYSPQLFLLRKKDFERASIAGESSLNILQASASKLLGFTPRIQHSGCMLSVKPDNFSASACNILIIISFKKSFISVKVFLKKSFICVKLSFSHSVERLRIFRSRHFERKKKWRTQQRIRRGLDYLYETWHTCLSCSWLQNPVSDFLNFAKGLGYGLSKSKKRGKIIIKLWKTITQPIGKIKKTEATFWRSALLLSLCENPLCPFQLIKKLNSTERRALFDIFASPRWSSPRMRTKVASFFIFPRAFKQTKLRLYDQRWLK